MRLETGARPALIGVVHLLPLPGSPLGGPGLARVLERALSDASALADGGADAIIVENLGDSPFAATRVDPATIAAMTRLALAIRAANPAIPLGINVLRNDARAALAIAATVDAAFIRVNVHTGAMVTDQGPIVGEARDTLLDRRRLGAERVRIAADVMVKHAVPLGDQQIEDVAADVVHRGLADAVIVTGTGTGRPLDVTDLDRVRAATPGTPVWAGSGVTPTTVDRLTGRIDAAIVGTWLHEAADLNRPLNIARVAQMRDALGTITRPGER